MKLSNKTTTVLATIAIAAVGIVAGLLISEGITLGYEQISGFIKSQSFYETEPARVTQQALASSEPFESIQEMTHEDPLQGITISAKAYKVIDTTTGDVLFSHNEELPLPIASVTKLFTAFITEAIIPREATLTVSERALETEGWRGYFYNGQEILHEDLIYPLLLESSNDAAEVLAEYYPRFYFLQHMNSLAEELGLSHTTFDDPSGLSVDNISTAAELVTFGNHLEEHQPDIIGITTVDSYSNGEQVWRNYNSHREDEGFIGGKTGYTNAAQRTGLLWYEVGDHTIMIAILGSANRNRDVAYLVEGARALLDISTPESL